MGHLDCSAAKRAQSDRPAVCDSLLPPVLCAHNPRAAAADVTLPPFLGCTELRQLRIVGKQT
jgi:hypothetical protein